MRLQSVRNRVSLFLARRDGRKANGLLRIRRFYATHATMIIVQISDTHIEPENPDAEARMGDLERVVAAINGMDPAPDVVIHTGDLAHNGTPPKYDAATPFLDALGPPLLLAAGNRDDRKLIHARFPVGRRLLPDTAFVQYVVDDYPVRLIALDTLSETSNMGDFCETRAESLAAALAEETQKPTVLFMHHPPFEVVTSRYRWQFDDRDGITRLGRAVNGHAQVLRAFAGHSHRDARGELGHVPASSMPSVARDLRLGELPDGAEDAPVFQIHTYDAAQGFVTETRAAL